MVHPFGCHTYYTPNALADEWLSKIKLVKTTYKNKLAYRIEGLPCWTYDGSEHSDPEKWPDALIKYNSKSCWYGVCLAHSVLHTAILQERTKGGWNIVDGVSLKAVATRVFSNQLPYHASMEIYIKDKGYFRLDVSPEPRMIIAPELVWWDKIAQPSFMGNRYFCDTTGNYLKDYNVPYNPEWAGFPRIEPPPYEPPAKSYIKATTTPSGAGIWIKKI